MWTCPHCGGSGQRGLNFCPFCGQPVVGSSGSAKKQVPPLNQNIDYRPPKIFIVISCLLIAYVLVVAFSGSSSNDKPKLPLDLKAMAIAKYKASGISLRSSSSDVISALGHPTLDRENTVGTPSPTGEDTYIYEFPDGSKIFVKVIYDRIDIITVGDENGNAFVNLDAEAQ